MPIHPDLQPLLAAVPALDFGTLALTDIRAMADPQLLPPDVAAPELASTEDQQVDTPNGPLTVRIHRPLGDGPKPTVVFIHGGGWVVGSPAAVGPLTTRIAAYLGAVVVSISYRLAPEHRFPAAFDDAVFLTRWAADHVDELGGRPDAFAIAGESAGGNLAAATALALREDGLLAGQLLFNPATNLTSSYADTDSFRADADPALSAANAVFSIRSYLGGDHSDDWRASPAAATDVTAAPPAVIGVSGNDPLRDDALAYAAKLTAAGVDVEVAQFDDLVHAYAAQCFLTNATHQALVDTLEAFRSLMAWPKPSQNV